MDLARQLQIKAVGPNTAVTRKWGIPALKSAMDHLGLYGGPVRKPQLPIDEATREQLIEIISKLK